MSRRFPQRYLQSRATLFQAVAGRPPIEGETTSAIELRDLKNRLLDLRHRTRCSAATARIFSMIAPDPAQRFSSYDELVAELSMRRCFKGEAVSRRERRSRCS
jgi:hypothetical protein